MIKAGSLVHRNGGGYSYGSKYSVGLHTSITGVPSRGMFRLGCGAKAGRANSAGHMFQRAFDHLLGCVCVQPQRVWG